MIRVLVITHGRLASELIDAATRILGELPETSPIDLGWGEDPETSRTRIRKAIEQAGNAGTLILTDMFGGTPTNLSLAFLEPSAVEVVTGVNLPILLRVSTREDGESITEVARKARAEGRRSIYLASDVLSRSSSGT